MIVGARRALSVRVVLAGVVALGGLACGSGPETPAIPVPPPGETLASGGYTVVLPLGLQAASAYIPETNPLSQARIDLGRKLYFDTRLSASNDVSCATCHDPDKGFSDARPVSAGAGGRLGGRNSPTVINRLFSKEQFWDGRAADLEDQALGPIQNPIEMGHTLPGMIAGLQGIGPYAPEFERAFGSPGITPDRVAMAIAAYERTVVAGNAPFDRHQAGETTAMSEAAIRGMALFNDPQRGNCVTCHAGFNFTDESYHNLGVGMDREFPDLGRYTVTKQDVDRGAFKTPTLRNVTQTSPYMHDGSEATLQDVIALYDRGGKPNKWLSQEIKPLRLGDQEKADLLAFLEALTGEVHGREKPTDIPR